LGNADLERDVSPFDYLENRSGDDSGDQADGKFYLSVRHENVEEGEKRPHEGIGQQPQKKKDDGAEASQNGELLQNQIHLRGNENVYSARQHKDDRADQNKRQIIAEHSSDGSFFPDAPDVVERLFNLPQHFDDGPEKNHQADAGDQSALRIGQKGVGKLDHIGQDVLVAGQFFAQLFFQHFLKSEALGDAEGHSRDGDDRNQRIKGQGGRAKLAFVFVEAPNGKDQDPGQFQKERFSRREPRAANSPDVFSDEIRRFLNPRFVFGHDVSFSFPE